MRAIVEVEEIVALQQYKNIKVRICLEGEGEESIDELGDLARSKLKDQVRKLLKGIEPSNLAGGRTKQWAYKNGRRKKSEV